MGANIDAVEVAPAATADLMTSLQEPSTPAPESVVAAETPARDGEPSPASTDAAKRKRGRPPGARTGTGKRVRKRYDRNAAKASTVTPETPAAPISSGAAQPPLTAPVNDPPAPGAFVPPDAALVDFCKRPVRIVFGVLLGMHARLTGDRRWLPTHERELDNMTDAGALVLAARFPKIAENSPEAALALAAAEYATPRLMEPETTAVTSG